MEKRIQDIHDVLPETHRDLSFFVHHLITEINQYKEHRVKGHGLQKSEFFSSVHRCQEIIISELERASAHADEIESRYNEIVNIQKLQEFKESVPVAYKDLAIFCQELIKRFDDLKRERLVKIGLQTISQKPIDIGAEKTFLKVIEEVEREIMQVLEKTYEDIKNTGKPGYVKHFNDGIK